MMLKTEDIKKKLIEKFNNNKFRITKTGVKTVELQGAQFIADKPWIIREPNYDYANREIEWYKSQSLRVSDIPGKVPIIWQNCSDNEGYINSNYGWMVFSDENYNQYNYCLHQLINDYTTREAVMIYNRPSMQIDAFKNGMHDFCCTYAVQCFLNKKNAQYILDYHVFMRSNDAVYGFNNDCIWHQYVQTCLVNDLNKYLDLPVVAGNIIWNAGSLHVYERHFKFLTK